MKCRFKSIVCLVAEEYGEIKTVWLNAGWGISVGYSVFDHFNTLIFILLDGPKGSEKQCVFTLGGFPTGDRFEFGSMDQQVRNRGIYPA